MARKKKALDPGNVRLALLGLVFGILIGIAGYQLVYPSIAERQCASRLREIGGNELAVKVVCEGKSLQDVIASGQ